jgi:hypothetical protein
LRFNLRQRFEVLRTSSAAAAGSIKSLQRTRWAKARAQQKKAA